MNLHTSHFFLSFFFCDVQFYVPSFLCDFWLAGSVISRDAQFTIKIMTSGYKEENNVCYQGP